MFENLSLGAAIAIAVALLVALIVLIFSSKAETTCPEYGTVPVQVNNGDIICVPWEKVPDFSMFEE